MTSHSKLEVNGKDWQGEWLVCVLSNYVDMEGRGGEVALANCRVVLQHFAFYIGATPRNNRELLRDSVCKMITQQWCSWVT